MEAAQPDEPAGPGGRESSAGQAEDPLQRALALAYRYLNRRERTVQEMRLHLTRRGFELAAIERVIAVLAEQGYLDDARYARLFAEDKRTLEQWGAERIARTLLDRGIGRSLVDETLAAQGSEEDGELERAVALLRRRFSTGLLERREQDRALSVLLRKGYESEVALEALAVYNRLR